MNICYVCGKSVERVWQGERDNQGKKIYVDPATNRKWLRRSCPECVKIKANRRQMAYRVKTRVLTKRKCRVCNKKLSEKYYFYCPGCAPMDNKYDQFDWGCGYGW